jgi:hypothetical protein
MIFIYFHSNLAFVKAAWVRVIRNIDCDEAVIGTARLRVLVKMMVGVRVGMDEIGWTKDNFRSRVMERERQRETERERER